MPIAVTERFVVTARLEPSSIRAQLSITLGAIGAYLLGFFLLHPIMGAGVAALSTLPVIAAGWFWGFPVGLLSGLLFLPLNTLLLNVAAHQPGGWDVVVRVGGVPGSIALVLIGAITGRLRDAHREVTRQLAERRRLEDTLRESEERYRRVVETSPDAIVVTDLDTKVLICNRQAAMMHGCERVEEMIGKNAFEFIAPEDHERAKANAQRTLESGSVRNIEYTLLRKDGTPFLAELSASVITDADGRPKAFIGVVRDITERKRSEVARDAHLREQAALAEVSAALRQAKGLGDLAEVIAAEARRLVQADAAMLSLVDEERQRIVTRAAVGFPSDAVGLEYGVGDGIFGHVARTGSLYRTASLAIDPLAIHLSWAKGMAVGVCTPLQTSEGVVVGALLVARRHLGSHVPAAFDAEEGRLLVIISEVAANALQRVQTHERLEEAYLEAVLALANTVDARDTYTADHSQRMAKLAIAIAQELGCGHDEIQAISWAALLHDIGKIAIPDSILRKPGKLTEMEWEAVKHHPEVGARIVSPVRRLYPVVLIIRHHHERWDGTGYPDGLKGEIIPTGARIVTVVDSFVAITDSRTYRPARTMEEAIAELQAGAGTQFDPRIVEIFCDILARGVGEDTSTFSWPILQSTISPNRQGLGISARE